MDMQCCSAPCQCDCKRRGRDKRRPVEEQPAAEIGKIMELRQKSRLRRTAFVNAPELATTKRLCGYKARTVQ